MIASHNYSPPRTARYRTVEIQKVSRCTSASSVALNWSSRGSHFCYEWTAFLDASRPLTQCLSDLAECITFHRVLHLSCKHNTIPYAFECLLCVNTHGFHGGGELTQNTQCIYVYGMFCLHNMFINNHFSQPLPFAIVEEQ